MILSLLVGAWHFLGIVMLADFLTGVVHWLEDSYGDENTPFLGPQVILPNVIHHREPRLFTKSPFWRRNAITAIINGFLLWGWCAWRGPSWEAALLFTLGAFCNEIHCWAHRSPAENGPVINRLHRLKILVTPQAHAVHHTDPKNRSYCSLTNLVNPILDRVEFWRRAEGVIERFLGAQPRIDPTVKIVSAA